MYVKTTPLGTRSNAVTLFSCIYVCVSFYVCIYWFMFLLALALLILLFIRIFWSSAAIYL